MDPNAIRLFDWKVNFTQPSRYLRTSPVTMKEGEREGKGWELGRGERESEGGVRTVYSRGGGGGNQNGDCESAKPDPLLPRSKYRVPQKSHSQVARLLQACLDRSGP